jgi:hypothetical protein
VAGVRVPPRTRPRRTLALGIALWGGRGAFLPHGGDCKPRHCQCGWCT